MDKNGRIKIWIAEAVTCSDGGDGRNALVSIWPRRERERDERGEY